MRLSRTFGLSCFVLAVMACAPPFDTAMEKFDQETLLMMASPKDIGRYTKAQKKAYLEKWVGQEVELTGSVFEAENTNVFALSTSLYVEPDILIVLRPQDAQNIQRLNKGQFVKAKGNLCLDGDILRIENATLIDPDFSLEAAN